MNQSNPPLYCPSLWFGDIDTVFNTSKPCCLIYNQYSARSPSDFDQVREQMLSGSWAKACEPCRRIEAAGGVSKRVRQLQRKKYNAVAHLKGKTVIERINELGSSSDVQYKEVRTNTCNLRCHTCNSNVSSAIRTMSDGLFNEGHVYPIFKISRRRPPIKAQSNIVHDPKLLEYTRVRFVGGEPTMDPTFWECLAVLKESGRGGNIPALDLATNGIIHDLPKLVEVLNGYPGKMHICVSIDGVGDAFDYGRDGGTWEQVDHTVHEILKVCKHNKNISLGIACTNTIPMVHTLPEFIKWVMELESTYQTDITPVANYYEPTVRDGNTFRPIYMNSIELMACVMPVREFIGGVLAHTDPNIPEHLTEFLNQLMVFGEIKEDMHDVDDINLSVWKQELNARMGVNHDNRWFDRFCAEYPTFKQFYNDIQ